MSRVRFFDRDGFPVVEIDGQEIQEVRSFSVSAEIDSVVIAKLEVNVTDLDVDIPAEVKLVKVQREDVAEY